MHHAKATSAGSTEAGGNSRGLLRRAFAIRAASSDAKGNGVPAAKLLGLLAIFLLALFALAAPAFAAPLKTEINPPSNVSYASAHVSGKLTSPGCVGFCGTTWTFQYSKDPAGEGWTSGPGGFIFGAKVENEPVSGDITGLKGGIKYFVRLVASVSGTETVSAEPNPDFTTLIPDPPTIPGAVGASPIFSTSATATAKVKRPTKSDDVKCHFEYITDAQFEENVNINLLPGFTGATPVDCEQNPIGEADAETEKEVTANLPGLTPGTAYHLRLVAENAAPGVVTKEAAATFTTNPKVTKPAVLAVDDASDVTKVSAKVAGEVQRPAGGDPALDVNCRFEYVSDEQFTANPPGEEFAGATPVGCGPENPITSPEPGHPAVTVEVSAELTGLTPGVTYHLRLAAENGGGIETKDAASTFTTIATIPPSFKIGPITNITYTDAQVSGEVDAGNSEVLWSVEYRPAGTEEWYGDPRGYGHPVRNSPEAVSSGIVCSGGQSYPCPALKPGTTYQVRFAAAVVENQASTGVFYYSDPPYEEFTTRGTSAPPIVTLDPVTGVTPTTAHFPGTVNPNSPAEPLDGEAKSLYKTDWHFECTPACPPQPGLSGTIEAEGGSKALSFDASGLHANTFYEVMLVAHNELGTVETPVETFQTALIAPTVTSTAGASDGQGGYILQGVVNSNNSKLTRCEFEYGTTATYPNTYKAQCLPDPSGPDEVQNVNVEATEGQFKLSFRGQTTGNLPFEATTAEVQAALRALSQVGPTGVNVTGSPKAYVVAFAGPLAGTNVAQIKGSDGTTPLGGGAGVSASTETEGGIAHAVSVEAHLDALTVGSTYHFRIFVTGAGGAVSTVDRTFIPTLAEKENCPNKQLREENSSLALPECRAYELVSPPNKAGLAAEFSAVIAADGSSVYYVSSDANINGSGQGNAPSNFYVASRTGAGWKTPSNLNGPLGSLFAPPYELATFGSGLPSIYSADLQSSILVVASHARDVREVGVYLRHPDGSLTLVGNGNGTGILNPENVTAASADLSHVIVRGFYGSGIYEFVGTGNDQPRRVDVDNLGVPIATCATDDAITDDGRVIFVSPCDGSIWARIDGTTSIDVSASQCTRPDCNAPADSTFQGAAKDGSRVYFTTTQQLVNGDTDQSNDLYACDIPSGTPAPTGEANSCSSFSQVSSGDASGANVEKVNAVSEDGSTVYFVAQGVLAANPGANEAVAVEGDHNLYVWRKDSAHPAGQTTFLARLDENDISSAQATADGQYLVFITATQLVATDTDEARDVYRYDAETGELTRVSTNVFGVAGNTDGTDARMSSGGGLLPHIAGHSSHAAVSDDGEEIVFMTREALSPRDGNDEDDAYLWNAGHVSLISTGSARSEMFAAVIDGSGKDIFFDTVQQLTPSDGDDAPDIYDARVDGGFSVPQPQSCSGEACQPEPIAPPPIPKPETGQPGEGNPKVKHCSKGKVLKHGKCVKKAKKHSGKKHHGKKAGHKQGGGK